MTDQQEPTTPAPMTPEPMTPEPMPDARLQAAATPGPAAGSGRMRWVVALTAAAAVVVAIVLVVLYVGKGSTATVTTSYLPATTVAYVDVRLDLPGGQREQVAALLSRFPGFADQAALDAKLTDTFDRLLLSATKNIYSYSADVKPWFGGRVALALVGLPTAVSGGSAAAVPPVLGLFSVADATTARAELDHLLKSMSDAGTTVKSEAIDGATLWTIDDPKAATLAEGHAVVALTDNMLIVGAQDALVRSSVALGRGTGQTLAASATYSAAVSGLPDARLGTVYVDGATLKLALAALATSTPGLDTALAGLPDRVAGSIRAADGALTAEVRLSAPTGTATPLISGRASAIADHVPGDAVAFVSVNDFGAVVDGLLKDARPQLETAIGADQLKTVEALLGVPLETYFEWAGDAALAVRVSGSSPGAAVVALASDTAKAQSRLSQLGTIVTLASLAPNSGIHVATTDHGGTKITELTLDQSAGLKIGWALRDDLFVLGVGEGSVAWVLDTTPQTALSKSPAYVAALAAAGAKAGQGRLYVDVVGLRTGLEAVIPAGSRAQYELAVKPWLAPLTTFVSVGYLDGDTLVIRSTLSTQPK
ncbi:MAG: DUF3352 domain-containing protein [Candidatus Limnocylindrales bacterium]